MAVSYAIALSASAFGGLLSVGIWAEFLHWRLKKSNPEEFSAKHRDRWLSIYVGLLERCIITSLVIWLPASVGPIAAAIIGVKAAGSWSSNDTKSLAGRTRYFTALLSSMASVFWALAWGIWAIKKP